MLAQPVKQVKKLIKKYFVHTFVFQASSNKLSIKPSCITQLSKNQQTEQCCNKPFCLILGLVPKEVVHKSHKNKNSTEVNLTCQSPPPYAASSLNEAVSYLKTL